MRNPTDSSGRHVRHYLGRLASWAKSVSFIVQAVHSLDILQFPIKIRCLPAQQLVISDRLIEEQALVAMAASLTRAGVENARRSCESRWSLTLDAYKKRWRSLEIRTTVHAEMIVLDHFYRHGLSFAHDKRYIGCSKPSCFCCGVYMAGHPMELEERPCHNNVWVKWSLPRRLQHAGTTVSERSFDPMTYLGKITEQRIKEELARGVVVGRQRLFDSTTDLSASLPTIFDSMLLRSAQ